MRQAHSIWLSLLLPLVALWFVPAVFAATETEKRSFSVREGKAIDTIKKAAKQGEVDFVFTEAAVHGVRTSRIEGFYTPLEAFHLMLEGSPLAIFRHEESGVYAIKRIADSTQTESTNKPSSNIDMNRKSKLKALLNGLLAVGLVNPAIAQDTDSEEDVFELSPFLVTAEGDSGYVANGTMAGTRLRTSLKDVAASISAITKDFMEDIGADNAETLMTYTLGTEVTGLHGNFSGSAGKPWFDGDQINREVGFGVRVRGLDLATTTRDFFQSMIPFDAYNVDRVEVNRGANGLLFGNGSPGGILNNTTIIPYVERDFGSLVFEYGRFGSHRVEIDRNEVLIDGKLAVRVAAKSSDEKFMQDDAYIRDNRVFAAIKYQPTELTTLRGNVEYGRQRSIKPEWRPPFDGYTWWWDVGQPTYNATTEEWKLNGPVRTISALNEDGSPNGSIINTAGPGYDRRHPTLVFDNPLSPSLNIFGFTEPAAIVQTSPNGNQGTMRFSNVYLRELHAGEIGSNFYRHTQITDPAIFDFYEDILYGPSRQEGFRFHTANVTFEQLLPNRKGGIEVVYDVQDTDYSFKNPFNWQTYNITLDVNEVLLDGSQNPNFLRPYIASPSWALASTDKRSTKRATGFYEFDFRDLGDGGRLGKILGKHTTTLLYSEWERDYTRTGGRNQVSGLDYYYANPAIANFKRTIQGYREIDLMVYLGQAGLPTDANIQSVKFNAESPHLRNIPIHFYHQDDEAWTTVQSVPFFGEEFNKDILGTRWGNRVEREELESKVAIVHSELLWGNVISTVGWREDSYRSFSAPRADPDETGFFPAPISLKSSPDLDQTEDSFSWGVVGVLPEEWSGFLPEGASLRAFYNSSKTFQPTSLRKDIFGQPIASPSGNTEEYGIMFDAFEGKLSLRFAEYKSDTAGKSVDLRGAINEIVRNGAAGAWINIDENNIGNEANAQAFKDWYNSPESAFLRDAYDMRFTDPSNPSLGVTSADPAGIYLQTTDIVSDGHELELTYNPLSNWRIALNYAKQNVVTSNTARDAVEMMRLIEPVIEGPVGGVILPDGETWRERAQGFFNSVREQVAKDGFSQPEVRDNRVNLITNYNFNEGRLANVGIGGAIRYQSASAIGSGYRRDADLGDIPDLSRPFTGPSETNYDMWISYTRELPRDVDWKIQLNVRNIGVGKELVPVETHPNGQISSWRIADPMSWTIRNSFEF